MKKLTQLLLALPILYFSIIPAYGTNTSIVDADIQNQNIKYIPGQIVVKFKQESSGLHKMDNSISVVNRLQKFNVHSARNVFRNIKDRTKSKSRLAGLDRIYLLSVPLTADIMRLTAKLNRLSYIEYAEPHYLLPLTSIEPNDSLYYEQEYFNQIQAPQAWDVSKGDSGVIIGIIDSGVDWDHPDLADNIWINPGEIPGNGIDDDNNGYVDDIRGWDFVEGMQNDAAPGEDGDIPDNDPMDFQGHGTHVAGIAGAVTDNNNGVASLSWNCIIMPLRCGIATIDGVGSIPSIFAAQAYVYAAENGASVVNQSSGTSLVLLDGARYAFLNGVVIVNAAGNSNNETIGLLGTQPWALSVAAVALNDQKASYSSYGPQIDISAPGGDMWHGGEILSTTFNDTYGLMQGTSMASPVVAALAGLIKSQRPSWTPADIMFQITGTADNIDHLNPEYAAKLGSGRVNAYRALTETPPPPEPKIELVEIIIDDALGNNNGKIDPGETVKLILPLCNQWGAAQNVQANLNASHWAATVSQSISNYGTIPGISDLINSTKSNDSSPFELQISPQAVPAMIPFSVALSADNGYNKTFEFELPISPSVLIVDDDHAGADGDVEIESYYFKALKNIGLTYEHWDHEFKGTPSASIMQKYSVVVWACEWAFPSLDSLDRAELAAYLGSGGRLFLSGQDIGWDLNDPANGYPNEYNLSQGASKIFYEQYLHAQYIADKSPYSSISGISGDSIGNGLTFDIYQPNRFQGQQFPSVIEPIQGGQPLFEYPDGTIGAVKYAGHHRLVYFGFGGFEAIVDSTSRTTVMRRVLNWLTGSNLQYEPLKDTEDVINDYVLTANISSLSPIVSVNLYWDIDDAFPFNKITMNYLGDGSYQGSIPAQNDESIQYFVLVETVNGFFPYEINSFHAGPDNVLPVITQNDSLANTLNRYGPFSVSITAADNIGIDTNRVYIHYKANGSSEDSVRMAPSAFTDVYTGEFSFTTPLPGSSVVNYYFTAKDSSANHNRARYPIEGYECFKIGNELIANFEDSVNTALCWDYGDNWARTDASPHSGDYSMDDSPQVNYPPNSENILTLKKGLDLSVYDNAVLTFWNRRLIDLSDTCFVEASNNGINWINLYEITGTSFYWKKDTVALHGFSGAGNDSVRLRFRMVSDDAGERMGIYLDDMEVITNVAVSVEHRETNTLPKKFALSQNYPNPFNPETTIKYQLPIANYVELAVYNLLGQKVITLVNKNQPAGTYRVSWDGSNETGQKAASGVYLYKLKAKGFMQTRKMILMK